MRGFTMAGSPNTVRLPPLEEHEWSPSTRERLLASWLPAGQAPAKPSTVRVTLSRHEKLFEAWDPFGFAIFNGELPERDREVLVLRTAWLTRCRLQWAYHEAPAARAGLTSADISAITEGPSSAALDEWDRVLVSVVDQLHDHGTIDDSTWDTLAARYTTEQLIEVPMIAGHYMMIAYAVNSFGTPVPDGLAALPERDDS
jgi:4-carboxymuconolactone decarboxylase